MLEMICAIPENVGWTLVGFTACLCCVMAVKLGKIIVQAIKDRLKDEEEGEE